MDTVLLQPKIWLTNKGLKGRKDPLCHSQRYSKDIFLSNSVNKQNFIQQLGNNLQAAGCEVFHASSDADVLIAQKAIEMANEQNTVLVGDDTDLLVLLLHHSIITSKDLFFCP